MAYPDWHDCYCIICDVENDTPLKEVRFKLHTKEYPTLKDVISTLVKHIMDNYLTEDDCRNFRVKGCRLECYNHRGSVTKYVEFWFSEQNIINLEEFPTSYQPV